MTVSTEIIKPHRLPDETHHVVVKLETIHGPVPPLDISPLTYEVIGYRFTSAKDDVAARVHDASIIISTTCPLNAQTLGKAPYLKVIVTETVGVDHIDLDEIKRRGIRVLNSPGATITAVSEHALGMYFTTRRRYAQMTNLLYTPAEGGDGRNEWALKGSVGVKMRSADGNAPHTCQNEVVGMIGYGPIGQRIAALCQALGMKVLVAARKDGSPSTPPLSSTPTLSSTATPNGVSKPTANGDFLTLNGTASVDNIERTPFEEVLCQATVLMLVVPLTPQTKYIIGPTEIARLRQDCVVINVGRGGTVHEEALLDALIEGRISGAATDVFEREPAGSEAESVLLSERARSQNLVLTPHIAWAGDMTVTMIGGIVAEGVRTAVFGGTKNVLA